MSGWLTRHASAIEGAAAMVTAAVAVAALIGVKLQLDASEAQQQRQAARDAYRGHLALAVSAPDLAAPIDACAIMRGPRAAAYGAFVDHLLYSAELMISTTDGWDATFAQELEPHAQYFCALDDLSVFDPPVQSLLMQSRATLCPLVDPCEP